MDIESIALTIITTTIGLITFGISYRKTVTAKKERRKSAYKEIVSICLKTLYHNEINPTHSMLEELIRSKAREYEVERKNLPSVSILLEDMASKILGHEFIEREKKEELLQNIDGIRQEMLEEVTVEEEADATEILGSAIFAFMTLSVLILLLVYTVSLIGFEISSSDIVSSVAFALGILTSIALALSTKSRKESKRLPNVRKTEHGKDDGRKRTSEETKTDKTP